MNLSRRFRIALCFLAIFWIITSVFLYLQQHKESIYFHSVPEPASVIDSSFRIVERTTQRKRKPKPVKTY